MAHSTALVVTVTVHIWQPVLEGQCGLLHCDHGVTAFKWCTTFTSCMSNGFWFLSAFPAHIIIIIIIIIISRISSRVRTAVVVWHSECQVQLYALRYGYQHYRFVISMIVYANEKEKPPMWKIMLLSHSKADTMLMVLRIYVVCFWFNSCAQCTCILCSTLFKNK